ncbi:cyclic nucleotide-binding domain protein [Mycobacterium kansasii]|uniref:Cyclic nucleotide-binding domain protein n=1 Tax=Mycobacterium kansasii TaxID=1768 RepID=A0A1V3WG65_MYCKA|nr:cyclic nucleotide-binding domain protein [Mycobacterium kansasii]
MNPVRPQDLAAVEMFADIATEQLTALADHLKPLHSVAGEVLMRQGDRAESFAIITDGRVEVRHVDRDGQISVTELSPGLIVGEIALLRHTMRTATVIAKDDVCGYLGYNDAFEAMLAIPAVAERMVRTARQRLAAYAAPIPVSVEDHPDLLLRPSCPAMPNGPRAAGRSPEKPCIGASCRHTSSTMRGWPTCSRSTMSIISSGS